jgi:DNA primase
VDAVDEIKQRLGIAEYIGRSVALTRSGRSFRGLCPFHTEKTPSFFVFPDRGSWRCFGQCGEGGDLFTFVQKHRNVDFRTALQELAREANVQLTPVSPQKRSREELLVAIVASTADFYERALHSDEGAPALDYLTTRRGLSKATIDAFGLGWAPDEWRSLRDYLSTRGYAVQDMVDAGVLVGDGEGEPYDRFRGRIIVPIADERGTVVALGGRVLGDGQPKYLNSPQTEIFDKGRTLFGLDRAKDAIREAGEVVVVEGYMDVIGPWQVGVRNVVATMGTSLTEAHAQVVRRFASRVVLAMDPDGAGAAAAERGGSVVLGIASPEQAAASARAVDRITRDALLDLRVAILPEGQDPDEVARSGQDRWNSVVSSAVPFPDFLVGRLIGPPREISAQERRELEDRLRPILRVVASPKQQAEYVEKLARRLGEPNVKHAWDRLRPRPRRTTVDRVEPRQATSQEAYLLAIVLRHPSLRFSVRNLPPDLFSDSLNRELFKRWAEGDGQSLDAVEDEALRDRHHQIEALRLPVFGAEGARKAAQEKIHAILQERLALRQAALTADLASAEKELGANRIAELSAEAWMGRNLEPDEEAIVHVVIEELELGLSLHRQEAPELA